MNPRHPTPIAGLQPKQSRFLGRIGKQLSQMLKTMARGNQECIMVVGHKRMPDGRLVEVILHAKTLTSRDLEPHRHLLKGKGRSGRYHNFPLGGE